MNCDLCDKPVLDGQPRYGGRGEEKGGKYGAPQGYYRHYDCHVERFGRSANMTFGSMIRELRDELGVPPREPLRDGPVRVVKRSLVPASGSDYNRSENAARVWRSIRRIGAVGRTKIEIECPFCSQRFWAFVWSLSGGGKKCPNCGSIHASFGHAYPLVGNEEL